MSAGIEQIAALDAIERANIFRATAAEVNISEAAIEKDFWVCWALHRIFSDTELSKQLLFKGGTSLSKCYGLIKRFSEDIDLILDWELLTKEDPYLERSNTQQDRFNKKMEVDARAYVQSQLIGQFNDRMSDNCTFQAATAAGKPRSIMMSYPRAFTSTYIKPEIELEIGPMSGMTPNSSVAIKPYCHAIVENVFGATELTVRAIEAKKTFWDKITILHTEAHRPEDKGQPVRYSRHYYDIYQMLNSEVVEEAMADLPLLAEVVAFKHKFYPQGWANYEGAKVGTFRLIPEQFRIDSLRADYAQMKEMIFGDYPDFDSILQAVTAFQNRLNTTT
jgi:Nucleotidyl transferase AbiEii toxin, Type IV TA system